MSAQRPKCNCQHPLQGLHFNHCDLYFNYPKRWITYTDSLEAERDELKAERDGLRKALEISRENFEAQANPEFYKTYIRSHSSHYSLAHLPEVAIKQIDQYLSPQVSAEEVCPECNGEGEWRCDCETKAMCLHRNGLRTGIVICHTCHGSGKAKKEVVNES